MQMDSYHNAGLHDEIPCFYPRGAAPASPDLPFGIDASSLLVDQPAEAPWDSEFHDYYGGAAVIAEGAGQRIDALVAGRMEVDPADQCQVREEVEEAQRRPGAVESSRGFRHMMRERQRREKLSQSYADLYALVAARSKGDKNSIVQSAAIYIHELRGARDQLQRRNEELKARILGHDPRQPSVKLDFEVDHPASGIDSMIGALRRLKSMGMKARGIRSSMSGGRMWTEMNVETTIAACDVEKAVEEALMNEVGRKQQPDSDTGAGPFRGTNTTTGWGPQPAAATHVQNVF